MVTQLSQYYQHNNFLFFVFGSYHLFRPFVFVFVWSGVSLTGKLALDSAH
jgi:hypothetical protein